MAHKLVARLSSQSHSTDRDFSPSRGDPRTTFSASKMKATTIAAAAIAWATMKPTNKPRPQKPSTLTYSPRVSPTPECTVPSFREIWRVCTTLLYCLREPVTVI
uniref:Uncharacterized protein n=1 Tax=Macrostomum lignano TaxID=282301 RepID=A0A1I8FHR9_9PLAT